VQNKKKLCYALVYFYYIVCNILYVLQLLKDASYSKPTNFVITALCCTTLLSNSPQFLFEAESCSPN
jgi:hypothetical protein